MSQDYISQTPLDQMVSTDRDQLLKAAIPYLPPKGRQILSIYEKSMELLHTVSVFGNPSRNAELSAMSLPSRDPMEMLSEIRSFCYGTSKEKLDQILNMMAMFQMLQLMSAPSDSVSTVSKDLNEEQYKNQWERPYEEQYESSYEEKHREQCESSYEKQYKKQYENFDGKEDPYE